MNARRAALDILGEVADGGAFLNLSLKKHLPVLQSQADRRFCAALVSTCTEHLLRIDYVLNQYIASGRVHRVIRNILRLGACQLLFFESVPVSAAVNESVKLAVKSGKKELRGFVNGVLRRVSENLGSFSYPDEAKDPVGFMSVFYSCPKWMCERFISDFGYDTAVSLLSFQADRSYTCVRLEQDGWTADDKKQAEGFLPGKYCADARYIRDAGAIEDMPLYKKGLITPQSEASMLCVMAAGIRETDEVLDVCAAPGGKAAFAAKVCRSLTATDIYPHRTDLIRRSFVRLHITNSQVEEGDGTQFKPKFEKRFDVVLLDAPCSALGLFYRKPDIKLHASPEKLSKLAAVQKKLLANSSRYVKAGGVLVYSTCTVNPAENSENVRWFLKNHPDFRADDFSAQMPVQLAERAKEGCLQLWPFSDQADGFFIARIRRSV